MTPEKVAVLVITGVIAVLLSITLMGSSEAETRTGGEPAGAAGASSHANPPPAPAPAPRSEPAPRPRVDPDLDWNDVNHGRFRTLPRPDPRPDNAGGDDAAQAPASAGGGVYKVKSGDTLDSIAKKVYGRRSAAESIRALNGNLDPRRLKPGMELKMPLLAASDARRANAPAAAPPAKPDRTAKEPEGSRPVGGSSGGSGAGRTHVVAKGEALQTIAKSVYGRSSEWEKIWQANRDQLSRPEALRPGMTLRIP